MSVRIRLQRLGKKKAPFYRIVVADSRTPRDGKVVEILGTYDPGKSPIHLELKQERVTHWLSVGAQPSETVYRLFSTADIVPKVSKTPKNPGLSRKDKKAAA
ncbi:MAG: 30S ribosomal protein S16 [Candidatus Margulisiibacteriota bacterium]